MNVHVHIYSVWRIGSQETLVCRVGLSVNWAVVRTTCYQSEVMFVVMSVSSQQVD